MLELSAQAATAEDDNPNGRMAGPDARDGTEQILQSVLRLQVLDEADDYGGMAPRRRARTGHGLELVEVHSPRVNGNPLGAEAGVAAGGGREEMGRSEDRVCTSQNQGLQESDFRALHDQTFLSKDIRTPNTHEEWAKPQKDGRRQRSEVVHVQDVGTELAQQAGQGEGRSDDP